jgi:hypothetical protein
LVDTGKVAPHALLEGGAAEPDEQDPPRARVVGERELQVVGVLVSRAKRIVEVHAALKRAVEPQVPRLAVVHHGQAVVPRVLRVNELEALARGDDLLALAALTEERRPVLGGHAGESPSFVRRKGEGRRDRGCDERRDRRPRQQHALAERDEAGRDEETCGQHPQQLVRAYLGNQEEGRREGADDASRGGEREQAAGGLPQARQRARS